MTTIFQILNSLVSYIRKNVIFLYEKQIKMFLHVEKGGFMQLHARATLLFFAALFLIGIVIGLTSCSKKQEPPRVGFRYFEAVDTLKVEHHVRFSQYLMELNAVTHGDLFEAMRAVLDSTKQRHPDEMYHLKYKYRIYPEF